MRSSRMKGCNLLCLQWLHSDAANSRIFGMPLRKVQNACLASRAFRLISCAVGASLCLFAISQQAGYAQVSGESPAERNVTTDRLLHVNWKDPEILAFVSQQTQAPRQALQPEGIADLTKLKLPVLAFDRPPSVVVMSFAVTGKRAERKRTWVTDPENPVWYTLIDEYEGINITIDADLRIQQDLADDVKVYTPPQGLTMESNITVIDREVEEGMEGLIAEYSIHKFPAIPYRVTIECTALTRHICSDRAAILADSKKLRIISARPPN
jgi:hypothetical protein